MRMCETYLKEKKLHDKDAELFFLCLDDGSKSKQRVWLEALQHAIVYALYRVHTGLGETPPTSRSLLFGCVFASLAGEGIYALTSNTAQGIYALSSKTAQAYMPSPAILLRACMPSPATAQVIYGPSPSPSPSRRSLLFAGITPVCLYLSSSLLHLVPPSHLPLNPCRYCYRSECHSCHLSTHQAHVGSLRPSWNC